MSDERATVTLDERGKRCPLPIISLGKAAAVLPAGSNVTVISDDPAARTDIAAWCRMRGAELIGEDLAPAAADVKPAAVCYRVRLP